MKKFIVSYTLKGTVEVEASSKKEAEEIVEDTYFPELLNAVEYDKIFNCDATAEDEEDEEH